MRTLSAAALSLTFTLAALNAQTDPGPRRGPGPVGGGPFGPAVGPQAPALSGRPLDGLSSDQIQMFNQGRDAFLEISDVPDGLGPRFNLDSCVGCHAHPAVGGSSPPLNPQLRVAAKFGAINQAPPFLQQDGPVRVVRFRRSPDGSSDGGVHNLFVITGRTDAPAACKIQQPDFSNRNNLSFRIPTSTFGLGLIEAIADSTLRANLAANATRKGPLGIRGRFNNSGNDGTITRFGWKAQNKSIAIFSGEAYNVEVGVTNDLFPQEREEDSACSSGSTPEDHPGSASDVGQFSAFMRFLAAPTPTPATASVTNGAALFDAVGCALCHTQSLKTGANSVAALRQQNVNLYSDLALHRMGQALNDGITQGAAQGDEWRTAPLWGLGDRLFLLHDGRTQDLLEAIRVHDSQGSEAHTVVTNFQALSADQKQDLLNFLRSL